MSTINFPKVFTLTEPVYESSCKFYIGIPWARVFRELERDTDPEWFASTRDSLTGMDERGLFIQLQCKSGLTGFVVWVQRWSDDDASFLTLNHEILHLVIAILDRVGVPVRANNDETICRMQACYLRMALRKIFAKTRKKVEAGAGAERLAA